MSHEYINKERFYAVGSIEATGVVLSLDPAVPIDVYRWGVIFTGAVDPDANGIDIQLRHTTPIGGSPVVIQTISRADAETSPAGQMLYGDVLLTVAAASGDDSLEPGNPNMPRSVINVGPAGPLLVNVGQRVDINVSNAAAAQGTAHRFFIEYVEHDFNPPHRMTVTPVKEAE